MKKEERGRGGVDDGHFSSPNLKDGHFRRVRPPCLLLLLSVSKDTVRIQEIGGIFKSFSIFRPCFNILAAPFYSQPLPRFSVAWLSHGIHRSISTVSQMESFQYIYFYDRSLSLAKDDKSYLRESWVSAQVFFIHFHISLG